MVTINNILPSVKNIKKHYFPLFSPKYNIRLQIVL